MSSAKMGLMIDNKGKTFTATRLGNFSSGKSDQQFFHYTGDRPNGNN